MKIGVFTETFLPNIDGVVVSVLNMNRFLIKQGHEVCVFTVGKGPHVVDGYDVFRARGLSVLSYKCYQLGVPSLRIIEHVAGTGIDVLHTRGPFTMGLMAKHISRLMNLPLIGTFDTPIQEYVHYLPVAGRIGATKEVLSRLAVKYAVWYYNGCDIVTTPSETVKRQLIKMGCKKRVVALSNGVDIRRYNPDNYSNTIRNGFCRPDEHMILHVGRITKEKRVDMLLVMAKHLMERKVKFRLIIVGKGPALKELTEASKNMGLSEYVTFTGFVADEELPKYYATADVFVTASPVETQGIVLLEALASGTPIVGARAGAIPELVENKKNGLLFRMGDAKDAGEKIAWIFEDDGLRKRLSGNAKESVAEHSLENVCKKLEKIYEEMIK